MKRLLFFLAAIEFTMACQPVPKPTNRGRGGAVAKIKLITDANYDPGKVGEYMGYFPQTKIEEYSAELGDFGNLNSANVGGHFAYTFTLYNCDCGKVAQWLQEIVASSEHYQRYNLICPFRRSTPKPIVKIEKEIIIEKPATTKAPTTTKAPPTPKIVYVPQQPQYIFVTPPPQPRPVVVYGAPPQQPPPQPRPVVVYGAPPQQPPPQPRPVVVYGAPPQPPPQPSITEEICVD